MRRGKKRPRTQGSSLGLDVQLRRQEISISKRELPPAHYLMKVESYNFLSRVKKYESRVFEVEGYKWRLSFYPNGDIKNSGSGFISLYLVVTETEDLPYNWELNVNFKLFVYNHLEDKYLTIQDADGAVKRFNGMKTKWGFAQLLLLETFMKPSNGYLVDDSCTFGAEIFVIKRIANWETLSLVKGPSIKDSTFTWKIENFSTMKDEGYESDVFYCGGTSWMLVVYPKGEGDHKGESLAIFLSPVDFHVADAAVYARVKLCLINQADGLHYEKTVKHWFFPRECLDNWWGILDFFRLKYLYQEWNGYLKNDTVIVKVEFLAVSETKAFPETKAFLEIEDGKEESNSNHSSGNKTGSESEK